MGRRIPDFLRGAIFIRPLFWRVDMFASDLEEKAVKSYRSYRANATYHNYQRYHKYRQNLQNKALKNGNDKSDAFLSLFLPHQDYEPRRKYCAEIEAIILEENPYKNELEEAQTSFNANPTKGNELWKNIVTEKFNHIVMDWRIETGLTQEDPRPYETLGERPADLRQIPFPSDQAKRYSFKHKAGRLQYTKT